MTSCRGDRLVSAWSNRCWRGVLVAMLTACTATDSDRSAAEKVYIGRGSSGRLDCPYSAEPPVTIIVWLKNGHLIDPESRIRVSKAGSLLIRAATVDDEGHYACAVYSPSGSTESSPSVQLLVRGKHAMHPIASHGWALVGSNFSNIIPEYLFENDTINVNAA